MVFGVELGLENPKVVGAFRASALWRWFPKADGRQATSLSSTSQMGLMVGLKCLAYISLIARSMVAFKGPKSGMKLGPP